MLMVVFLIGRVNMNAVVKGHSSERNGYGLCPMHTGILYETTAAK